MKKSEYIKFYKKYMTAKNDLYCGIEAVYKYSQSSDDKFINILNRLNNETSDNYYKVKSQFEEIERVCEKLYGATESYSAYEVYLYRDAYMHKKT